MSGMYGAGWLLFVLTYRPTAAPDPPAPSRIAVPAKGLGVFVLSFALFSVRQVLHGSVVTFPFSGVFAVVECRDALEPLAAVFSRSSLGMLALLAAMRELREPLGLWAALLVGWLCYVVVLALVRRLPGRDAAIGSGS